MRWLRLTPNTQRGGASAAVGLESFRSHPDAAGISEPDAAGDGPFSMRQERITADSFQNGLQAHDRKTAQGNRGRGTNGRTLPDGLASGDVFHVRRECFLFSQCPDAGIGTAIESFRPESAEGATKGCGTVSGHRVVCGPRSRHEISKSCSSRHAHASGEEYTGAD